MKDLNYKERFIWMDMLRILAAFFVVVIHVAYVNLSACEITALDKTLNKLLYVIVSCADPLFFMISGSMLLSSKKNYSFKSILNNKIKRLVIAFCFWSFLYAFIENFFIRFLRGGIKNAFFYNFFKTFILGYNHLWFIYALIFAYLCVPFIRKICEEKKNEELFIALSFIPLVFSFISEIHSFEVLDRIFEFSHFQIVSGYTAFFILGHYLFSYDILPRFRVCCYSLTIILVIITVYFDMHYDYVSLVNLFIASSFFLVFKYGISKIRISNGLSAKIVNISSLTFGTYLCHMLFAFALYPFVNYFRIAGFSNLLVLLECVVVYTISLLLIWILSRFKIAKKYII